MDNEDSQSSFVSAKLPWLVAAVALVVYVLTLNHWVTVGSLPITAKVAAWDWDRTIANPLLYLATYPFRFFPASLQPVALNFFSALTAALTLGLLARSVALLPHDRTREQRQRERSEFSLLTTRTAAIPVVFATLIAGLELSFWEHATAITGEMLNLLLFAYIIRCLLEFRIDQKDSWLMRMAFVYGLAITNNWAMIGFLPGFLLALIWIKGVRCFQFGFLIRLAGLGAAGLLLYLLLPLVSSASGTTSASFWTLFKNQLIAQKNFLMFGPLRSRALLCSLTAVLPVFVMGIRWPSTFGDMSSAGAAITSFMFKIVHGMFLAACVWVAFDPEFSPRRLGMGLPFLTFYYLGALSVGYFSGYFLLVFGEEPKKSWAKAQGLTRVLNQAISGIVQIAPIAVAVFMVQRNFPSIRFTNGPMLKQFAGLCAQALPARSSVVLSDDAVNLLLIEAKLSESGQAHPHMLANTRLLPFLSYQRHMMKHYPGWPKAPLDDVQEPIDSLSLLALVNELSQSNALVYAHPSFGYYFEYFYLQPNGVAYDLKPYPPGVISPPAPSAELIQANQSFWKNSDELVAALARPLREKLPDAEFLGRNLSRAINYWGVQLQRNNRLDEAAKCFAAAQKLNPDNIAAITNARFNENLRARKVEGVQIEKALSDKLAAYANWVAFVQTCGPVDEPSYCLRQGEVFAQGSLYRQAAQELMRATALKPDNVDARLQLASVFIQGQRTDKALEVINDLKAQHAVRPLPLAQEAQLASTEATAYFNPTNLTRAESILQDMHRRHPEIEDTLINLGQLYLRAAESLRMAGNDNSPRATELYKQAIATLDKQLTLTPNSLKALLNRSALHIQVKDYASALRDLNQVLKLDPKNIGGLMNRGIANFHLGKLDDAKADYEELLQQTPTYAWAFYRLAEIAGRKQNAAEEISNYQKFLRYAPTGAEEVNQVKARLQKLKGGA